MEFKCKRCNQEFCVKSHLKSHLQRENPCEFLEVDFDREILIYELYNRKLNEKTFDCDYCGLRFNYASGKSQHKKICKKRPKDEIIELTNRIFILEEEK